MPASPEAALADAKQALRRRLLAARAGLTEEQRHEAGRQFRDTVLSLPEAQMAGTVAAYYSVGTEPPSRGLVYALWKRGSYVLLPVVRSDGNLDWASYEGPDSLAPAGHGLLEPAGTASGHSVASADLVIVPALAADRRGNRLGRGRGCYDRALAHVGPLIPPLDAGHRFRSGLQSQSVVGRLGFRYRGRSHALLGPGFSTAAARRGASGGSRCLRRIPHHCAEPRSVRGWRPSHRRDHAPDDAARVCAHCA